jgi:hypothetical protein
MPLADLAREECFGSHPGVDVVTGLVVVVVGAAELVVVVGAAELVVVVGAAELVVVVGAELVVVVGAELVVVEVVGVVVVAEDVPPTTALLVHSDPT